MVEETAAARESRRAPEVVMDWRIWGRNLIPPEGKGRAVWVDLLVVLGLAGLLWGGVHLPQHERRPGAGRRHHDLHRPGVEHDVQLLPLAARGAARPARGGVDLPAELVAAPQMAGAAVRHDGAGVEQHDEHGGRLVLPDD